MLQKLAVVLLAFFAIGVLSKFFYTFTGSLSTEKTVSQSPESQSTLVREGDVVIFPVLVKNELDHEMKILNIQTSCSCMLPKSVPVAIPANSQVEIPIRIDMVGKAGLFSAEVLVRLGGEELRRFSRKYYVVSETLQDIHLDDSFLHPPRESQRFSLEWPVQDDSISEIQYDHNLCKLEICERSSTEYTFSIVPSPGVGKGEFRIPVILRTDGVSSNFRRFTIVGRVAELIEIQDPSLALGSLAVGDSANVEAVLFSPYKKDISVEAVEAVEAGDGVSIEWDVQDQTSPRVSVALKVTNRGDAVGRLLKSRIVVTCEVEREPVQVEFEVYGFQK